MTDKQRKIVFLNKMVQAKNVQFTNGWEKSTIQKPDKVDHSNPDISGILIPTLSANVSGWRNLVQENDEWLLR